jgi:hypothetical protein
MKKVLLAAIISSGLWACGGGSDADTDKGTGDDRQENVGTLNEPGNNTPANEANMGDSTPTTNSNIYNTDSAAGQGTTYDTAARNPGGR